MSTVTISFTPPTKRKDDTALPPEQIKQIDFELSADNGTTWTNVGHRAANDSNLVLQDLDVGQYLIRDYVTDTQNPALTSDFSAPFGFEIKAPQLAAPNPAVITGVVVA